MPDIAVQYIGSRPEWRDRLYDSGLSFTTGQTRTLPAQMASRLLRHADLFAEGKAVSLDKAAGKAIDDTAALLQEGKARQADEDRQAFELDDLHREVNMMDRDTLASFARDRYGLNLPRNRKLDEARAAVHARIDQFGPV